ncbi:MAG: heme A synthase [Flavobacteriaceae bacterium]|nr:heme A synthase [Flavobacteriaceae bacterium]
MSLSRSSRYTKSVKVALVLVYLVIIAGALVRMTGSGMGCPDWPKCFGYYIPPTDASVLNWDANREFKKGQVIIRDAKLKVAGSNFTTGTAYVEGNWENYTRHDYAEFNVWHTWIEYINRLLGALSGLAILVMAVLSFWKWNFRKRITYLSVLSVFLIAFQAWLGAIVVYSVLAPVKITIHMVMALVIVAVLIYLLYMAQEGFERLKTSKPFRILLLMALALTMIQVILGTQIRQFVDEQVKAVGYEAKALWLETPNFQFYVHRTFSILVLLLNLSLWYLNRKYSYGLSKLSGIVILIVAEAITGILMYYFDFPFLSQPLHLVIAAFLFGLQFYVVLEVFQKGKPIETS